jgi:hypothetical protein
MSAEDEADYEERILAGLDHEIMSAGVLPTESDALHYYLAAVQTTVIFGLPHIVPNLVEGGCLDCDPEEAVRGLTVDSTHEEMTAIVDRLGDIGKLILTSVQQELSAAGMGDARPLIFLPCHGGLATIIFSDESPIPQLIQW